MAFSDQQAAAEVAEALAHDPSDGGEARSYQALARVVDDDPTFVFNDGNANGCTVECMVLTGPFVGTTVRAMYGCPVGAPTFSPVTKGARVLVAFLDGVPDGHCVLTHSVPGGKENPLPSVVAGVSLEQALAPENEDPKNNAPPAVIFSPPKKVGSREYYMGALKVIRLKGKQDDFFSGFVVSADDGTSMEVRYNSLDKSYVIEAKSASGERLSVGSGFASLFSADGNSSIQVSNDQVLITGKQVTINGSQSVQIDGGVVNIGMGLVPPTPINACAVGPAGPANLVSARVFIGLV
jgi:hypothetical protein